MIVVGVDLLFVVPGVVGGSEDYCTALLRSFAAHKPSDVELRLFVQESFRRAHPDLGTDFEMESVDIGTANKAARIFAENTWLARASRRHGVAMQHHFGGRLPTMTVGPQIITLHDLQPLERPENFGFLKKRFLQRAIPRSIERAARVVTVGDTVRAQVLERFDRDPSHVLTIASGLGPPSQKPAVIPDGLPERFVIYPAVTHPHKNHRVLFEALAELRRRGERHHLVLVGGAGAAAGPVAELIESLDLNSVVHHLGRVERATVDELLRRADAMVFPSLYEGFGLPVLEALRAETPVIASDIEPIRSIVGQAARLVDPRNPGAWADALLDVAPHDHDRAAAVLERYSPASRAELLATLYRSVASEHAARR